MKKDLPEADMTESKSQMVRKTMKQGILNVQPLLVYVAKKSSEKSIPYAVVSDVQPSDPKRKFERSMEAMTTKTKKGQATSH